jgi:hypothetical protein
MLRFERSQNKKQVVLRGACLPPFHGMLALQRDAAIFSCEDNVQDFVTAFNLLRKRRLLRLPERVLPEADLCGAVLATRLRFFALEQFRRLSLEHTKNKTLDCEEPGTGDKPGAGRPRHWSGQAVAIACS